jgi:integrase
MASGRLTALRVKTLKAKGRYPDGDGLFLQIGPTGAKSWLLRYQLNHRERYMGLGPVKNFTLKEARERARKARQLLSDGIDPIEHRMSQRDFSTKEARERLTFKEAAEQFLEVHEPTWRNAKHRAQWRSSLKAHAFPTLAHLPVSAIDQGFVNAAVAGIWTTTPETARRAKGRIERIVTWVTDGQPLPTRNGKPKRGHAALPWRELPTFIVDLRKRESISARALEYTILTAARTGETIGAKWDEIDLEARVWTIPADRMKSYRPHRVPLSSAAVELLASLPTEEGNDRIFIGGKKGHGLSNMAMLEMLKDLAPGTTVHGFRSTFKDWASEATPTPNMVSEAALAHIVADKVEAAYRRGDLFTKRVKLMTEWAAYCGSEPAEIIPLHKKQEAMA